MIVDHADRLHEGIANRRAHEFEAPPCQVAAQRHRFGSRNGNRRITFFPQRVSVNKSPDVRVETAELLLYVQKSFGILNRGRDLQAIANDSFVREQLLNPALIVSCDLSRVEIVESAPVILAFSQNRFPAEPGLRTFENQKLEQCPIVVNGDTPLTIVIIDRQWSLCPGTTA